MQAIVSRNAGRLIFGAALVLMLVGVLLVSVISVIVQQQQQGCDGGGGGVVGGPPTKAGKNAIPARLLPIYRGAEQNVGVPWNVLAAINAIETDFGRNLNVSSAGAIGWMQFLPSTWAQHGRDGNGDGKKDPYNPADAIFSAAGYLDASGSDRNLHDAIFAYNHAEWYVQDVLAHARRYAQGNFTVVGGSVGGSDEACAAGIPSGPAELNKLSPSLARAATRCCRPGRWPAGARPSRSIRGSCLTPSG